MRPVSTAQSIDGLSTGHDVYSPVGFLVDESILHFLQPVSSVFVPELKRIQWGVWSRGVAASHADGGSFGDPVSELFIDDVGIHSATQTESSSEVADSCVLARLRSYR